MTNMKRWTVALLVAALAVLAACSSSSGFNDNSDCDYLVLPGTADGEGLSSLTFACVNAPLSISFDVKVEFLGPTGENGGLGNPPDPSSLAQFLLEHYDVSYRNLTTGRSVAGVDVPQPFRTSVQSLFDMSETETLTLTGWPVLQAGAKAQAPLNNDGFYPDAAGVVLEATITFWGHPVTDDNAWCYGTVRWIFTVSPC